MSHEVYVEPRNEQAGVVLRQKFATIDDKFRSIHDQNFMHDGERCEHGLLLYDQDDMIFAHAPAHWDYDHLMATKADVEAAVQEVLGSTDDYKIRESW